MGQIAKSRPELKIANLGVSSYSPSIYFSKVNFLLQQGITFKELVVYIDISDIQDEAISYELLDGVVVPKGVAAPKGEVVPKITAAPKDVLVLIGDVPPNETLVPKGVKISNNSNLKKRGLVRHFL